MSSADFWIDIQFDKDLSEKEQFKIQEWLDSFIPKSTDDCVVLPNEATIFWIYYDQMERIRKDLSFYLPEDVSARLFLEYLDSSEETETFYYGPKAKELELEDIDAELVRLLKRKEELMACVVV